MQVACCESLFTILQDSMCCLSKPDDKPELDAIRNKWMTPKDLIRVNTLFAVHVPLEMHPLYALWSFHIWPASHEKGPSDISHSVDQDQPQHDVENTYT